MQTAPANLYEFGDFQLDPAKRVLRRLDGTLVPLTPRVFETLLYMVEHHDSVLDKERIMEAVWPDSIVEENNLAQAISKLRQVFGETPGSHGYIVTVPGRGYRFVAGVNKRTEDAVKNETANGRIGETARSQPASGLAGSPQKPEAVEVLMSEPRRVSGLPAKTGWLWAIAFVAVAIVSLLVLFFVRHRSFPVSVRAPSSPVSAATVLSAPTPIPEKSIAVLPFDNLSDDKQNTYFAAGVQDEIISNLARIAELKVISRTSANLYKGGNPRNSHEIGQQLGVAHLLEGSVQRIGNRLRVNAQLIDARTDTHSWAQTYDRNVADLFAIQSEIAQAIAGQLHARISPAEKLAIERPPTADLTAFELYLRARESFRAANPGDGDAIQKQVALLDEGVARDPAFVPALCLLSQIHLQAYWFNLDHTPARLEQASKALESAARLQPDAGEVHLSRAVFHYWGTRDYVPALAELALASRSLPNDADVLYLMGLIERRQGRWKESIGTMERAFVLDPRNASLQLELVFHYRALKRYNDAKRVLNNAEDLDLQILRADIDFDENADLTRLQNVLSGAPATADKNRLANKRGSVALLQRDYRAAAQALSAYRLPDFSSAGFVTPHDYVEGVIARGLGDAPKAEAAFIRARERAAAAVTARPSDAKALMILAGIDAKLGRKEEAIREGERAVEFLPVARDALDGPVMLVRLAAVYAEVRENDRALDVLEQVVPLPNGPSYGDLKLDQNFDPLRKEPRFEQIVASLAPKEGRIDESANQKE